MLAACRYSLFSNRKETVLTRKNCTCWIVWSTWVVRVWVVLREWYSRPYAEWLSWWNHVWWSGECGSCRWNCCCLTLIARIVGNASDHDGAIESWDVGVEIGAVGGIANLRLEVLLRCLGRLLGHGCDECAEMVRRSRKWGKREGVVESDN